MLYRRELSIMSTPLLEIDFYSPSFVANPYPTYQYILEHNPVHRLSDECGGYTVISRYEDVAFVLKRNDVIERITNSFREPHWLPKSMHRKSVLLTTCPHTHHKHRQLFRSALSPAVVKQLHPLMRDTINSLLDDAIGSQIDLMTDIAFPFVGTIMSHITGITQHNVDQLRRWVSCIESVLSMGDDPPEAYKEDYMSLHQLYHKEYQAVIDARRNNPQGDFVSLLLRSGDLTDAEMRDALDLMVFAGFNTTSLQLGIILSELANNLDLFEYIKAHRKHIPDVVEEMCRYRSVSQGTLRKAKNAFVLPSGHHIPANTVLWVGSAPANYDARFFPEPEQFKLNRPNISDQLNFGTGPHLCLGNELGRAELSIALDAIAARVSHIKCTDNIIWRFPVTHRVIKELPFELVA